MIHLVRWMPKWEEESLMGKDSIVSLLKFLHALVTCKYCNMSFMYSFYRCINGCLKNKTRILVTHQLGYLEDVDKIYIMKFVSELAYNII